MMYKEKIVDVQTNEETWRDYNAAEIAEVEKAQAESVDRIKEQTAKETARTQILIKLGLTEEEAKLLLS